MTDSSVSGKNACIVAITTDCMAKKVADRAARLDNANKRLAETISKANAAGPQQPFSKKYRRDAIKWKYVVKHHSHVLDGLTIAGQRLQEKADAGDTDDFASVANRVLEEARQRQFSFKGITSKLERNWMCNRIHYSLACLLDGVHGADEQAWLNFLLTKFPRVEDANVDAAVVKNMSIALREKGVIFTRVSTDFVTKPGGGAAAILKERKGNYVVQVAVNYKAGDPRVKDDPEPERPCLAYNGRELRDHTMALVSVPTGGTEPFRFTDHGPTFHTLTDADRETTDAARAVFTNLYKGLKVTVENVFLVRGFK